ncbi:MAG: hypothetical protein HOP37_00245, partial [Cyclobacteriaceae bacterium]|nr:hypothetical protein [Cyclobacteriaceae bacterium]
MRSISLSIVFLWIHLLDGNAQSLLSGYALKDLSITQWTAEEGLSSNNTTSVFQSSDGLLWITSFNGFMTFDGERFETYDRNNLSFLETDGFYAVIENTDGSILIGSQGSGLIKYKLGEFSNYQPRHGIVPKSIRSLLRLKNGDVIIGSNNGGLFHLQNDTIKNVYHEQLQGATVMALVEDASGKIWIGTDGNGLFSWETRTQPQPFKTEGVFSKNVEALALSSKGILFIGTTKGLISIELINNQLKSHSDLDDNSINALWIDETFTIWIGTERGLIRYNEKLPTPDVLQSKNQIDFVRITKIANDLEGNLWITSNRSGLVRLKETNITNIQIPTISSNRVNIVHETKDGRLYVGTDANQLDICENNKCQTILLKTSIGGNGIRDIFEESKNSLWLATYSGIIHIQEGKEIVYSMAEGMPANDFRTVTKDRQGNFWFGSRSGGLVKFKDGNILRVYQQGSGLESNYILAVTEMQNGDIYVGTHSGGMTIISPNGETKTHHLRKDDAGILFFNIDQDKQGKVWVMANIGPIQFTGDSLRPILLHGDKKSKTYFDWIDDEVGSAWITTSSGVL